MIGVGRSDTLNMRLAPGVQAKIVDQLSYDAVNIMLTGQAQTVDGRLWVEAQRLHGSGSGWLNASYLTEYIPPAVFCADQRALALLDQTAQAFQKQDGEQLAGLVSPRHGLDVAYLRMGRVVNYAPSQVKWLFESTYAMQWGNHPGSGNPLRGAFHTLVLPDLMDVFNAPHETHCNSLALGGHSYIVERRAIYQNINYYALYRPGPPGEELNWRTWVVGVEYVQGQPMLFALDHFFWEP